MTENIIKKLTIKKSTMILILILLIFSIFFNYSNIKTTKYTPNSPDEAQSRFFVRNFIETGKLQWKSEFNNKYNTSIFHLRNMADLGNNVYAPKKSLLFVLNIANLGIFSKIEFFVPLFGLFGIIIFYMVLSKLFNKKIGLISTILVGISPAYLMYSNFYWENVPMLILVILSYYTFIRFIESKKIRYMILTNIFLVQSIFFRPVDTLLIISFFITLLILYKDSFNLKVIMISVLTMAIFSIPLLFLNKLVFGGFFNIPELMRVKSYTETLDDYDIVPMSLDAYYTSFLNHIILVKIVFILAIIGIIYTYLKGHIHQKRFVIAILVYSIAIFLFYGGRGTTYNFGDGDTISAVMNRYFLPISVISYIFAGVSIYTLYSSYRKNITKLIIFILILLVIIPSLNMNFVQAGGVDFRSNQMQELTKKMEVIKQLPKNSVILTSRDDKYIFNMIPRKETAIIFTEESPKLKRRPDIYLIYKVSDVDKEIKPLIIKLINDDMFTYIIRDSDTLPLMRRLEKDDNFKLKKINSWLWKVEVNKDNKDSI